MSKPDGFMVQPDSTVPATIWKGFSWPCFFLGPIWFASKKMWGTAFISLIYCLGILFSIFNLTTFIWLLYFYLPFWANGLHRKFLAEKGYYDPFVIDVIREKLSDGTGAKLNKFIHVSRMAGLTGKYGLKKELFKNESELLNRARVLSQVTMTLFKTAKNGLDELSKTNKARHEAEFKRRHIIAVEAAESAINIQETFLSAYLQLALLWKLVGENERVKEICKQGKLQIENMRRFNSLSAFEECHPGFGNDLETFYSLLGDIESTKI